MSDQAYEQAVRKLSELNAVEIIPNSNPAHAGILFSVLFDRARAEVKVFSKMLFPQAYNDKVTEAFKNACARGVRFTFLLESVPNSENGFYKAIQEMINNGSELVRLHILPSAPTAETPDRNNALIRVKEYGRHMCVVDKSSFRLEQSHVDCTAFASMNRPDLASNLDRMFNSFLQAAPDPYHLKEKKAEAK